MLQQALKGWFLLNSAPFFPPWYTRIMHKDHKRYFDTSHTYAECLSLRCLHVVLSSPREFVAQPTSWNCLYLAKTGSKRVFAFLTCNSQVSCPSHSSGFSLSLLSMWRAAVRLSPLQFCFATRLYSSASLVHKWPLSFPLLPPFFHTLPLIWYFFQSIFCFLSVWVCFCFFCSVLLLLSHRLSFNSLCISFYFLFSKPPVDPLSSVSSFIPA